MEASSPLDDYKVINALIKEINARWERIDFGVEGHKPEEVLHDLGTLIEGARLMRSGVDLENPPPDWRRILKANPIDATTLLPLIGQPIPYIVKPILVRGSLTQIQGVPKGGKSAFSVYLSLCATTGIWPMPQYLASATADPLKVVYITWEDPEIMMAQRLSLYAVGLGLEKTFLPKELKFLFGPDIFVERGDHMLAMQAMIQELKPDIVVIDTLSHIHLCEENASSEMKIPMKNLARIAKEENIALMYLHHTSKGSGDKLTQDKGRGSGAIAAAWHVLIDWGVRERGSNVNPVEVQSKYEHKFKSWAINYDAQEDEYGNVCSVKWDIDTQEVDEKPKSADKKRERFIWTFKKLHEASDWVTAIQVVNTCNLGLDLRTIQRHLREFCNDGILESKSISTNPKDPIHYRLVHRNGNLS